MIDPDVEIVDLDPDGFAWFNRLARGRGQPRWLWRVFDGASEQPDPESLLRENDVERVVLIDRRHSDALSRAITAAALPELTQQEWFAEAERIFWSSPAVRTAPAPPGRAVALLQRLLQGRPDGSSELHIRRGDDVFVIAVEHSGGRIRRLTNVSTGAEAALTMDAEELEAFFDQGGSMA